MGRVRNWFEGGRDGYIEAKRARKNRAQNGMHHDLAKVIWNNGKINFFVGPKKNILHLKKKRKNELTVELKSEK